MSRELLEKAAKAAGIEVTEQRGESLPWTIRVNGKSYPWNPLTDDGDAFRLAVKLDLCVGRSVYGDSWCANHNSLDQIIYESGDDPCAATRLAIVRAAAEIGERM